MHNYNRRRKYLNLNTWNIHSYATTKEEEARCRENVYVKTSEQKLGSLASTRSGCEEYVPPRAGGASVLLTHTHTITKQGGVKDYASHNLPSTTDRLQFITLQRILVSFVFFVVIFTATAFMNSLTTCPSLPSPSWPPCQILALKCTRRVLKEEKGKNTAFRPNMETRKTSGIRWQV